MKPLLSRHLQAAAQSDGRAAACAKAAAFAAELVSRVDLRRYLVDGFDSPTGWEITVTGGTEEARGVLRIARSGDAPIVARPEDGPGSYAATDVEELAPFVRAWTEVVPRWSGPLPASFRPLPTPASEREALGGDLTPMKRFDGHADCPRCAGTGTVPHRHVHQGVCFQCGGSGDALNIIVRAFMVESWLYMCAKNRLRFKAKKAPLGIPRSNG